MSKITTLFSCAVEKPSVIYFCCTCQGKRERCVLVQDNGGWPWPFEGSVCHKYLWAGPDMTQPDRFTRLSSTAVHSVCKPCRDFRRGRHHQRIKSWNSQSGQSVYLHALVTICLDYCPCLHIHSAKGMNSIEQQLSSSTREELGWAPVAC